MSLRDDHEQSSVTVPNPRPLPPSVKTKSKRSHRDGLRRRLVHNHPSGDPTPSRADITMTQQIIEIAKPMGIFVHDHIIVGKNGHASLKGLKLI